MTLSSAYLSHLAVALIVLCAAAPGCAYLYRRLRQPPVLGEVVGGLLLGPTLFERELPG
jgi:Kef-type K+ transport system membrane component KefB